MNRGASAAVQAQWAAWQNSPLHLAELAFDSADGGSLYITDAYKPVVWNSNTYAAVGHFLNFSGLQESMDLRVSDLTFQLSGVDQAYIAVFSQRKYIDRRLVINQAFFGTADALVVDPFPIHDGRMDFPRFVLDPDGGTATIDVASKDEFADFERLSGRHTNPHDQNVWFANDRSFDKLAQINAGSFVWGHIKEPPATGLGAALTRLVYSQRVGSSNDW